MPSNKTNLTIIRWLFLCFAVKLLACGNNKTKHLDISVDSVASSTDWGYNDNEQKKEDAFLLLKQELNDNKKLSTISKYKIYNGIYFYHFFKGDNDQAVIYADSMLYVLGADRNKQNYVKELASSYYCRGDALFRLGAYEQAYKDYFVAKKLQPVVVDKCANSNYSYRIAMILFRQQKYEGAIPYFEQCLDEVKTCRQHFVTIFKQQELFNNIALCFSRKNKIDSALVYYDKSMAFVNANDTLPGKGSYFMIARGVLYGNIGGELLKLKKYKKAETFLRKSIAINERPGFDSVDVATAKIKLIKTYLETEQPDSARKYLNSLAKSNESLKILDHVKTYQLLYAKYLQQIGNSRDAFSYLERYVKLNDSVQKQLDRLKATNIDERFRNLHNENEIGTLKKEAEIQQRYLYITTIFIVMAIMIVVLIYSYWRKTKKTVEILTALNDKVSYQKDKLHEALIKIGASDKEKDTILRAVAHDLRNPIVGISSLTKFMISEDEQGLNTDKLTLIDGACSNALTLIDDIIEAAENKEEIDFEGKKTSANLIEIIKNAIALSNYRAEAKQQHIQLEANVKELVAHVYVQKITRVISNLINNAIKFSGVGKHILIVAEKHSNTVMLKVIDNGIGIPAKYGDDIFQLFTSSKRFGTEGEKSYGLGLSICKQIVTAHGGKIWYGQNPKGGTIFYFTLPL